MISGFKIFLSARKGIKAREIFEELGESHPDLHYTEYEAGELKEKYGINPHCSWVPAGRDAQIKEWLFTF